MASNTKNRFRLVQPVSTMAAAQFVPPPSKQRSRMQNWTFQVGATDPNRTRVTNHNHATQSGLHPCSLFCCKWALLKREQSCISGRESGMWREKKMHPQNLMQTCETLKFYRTRLVCINQRINLLRPVPVDSTGWTYRRWISFAKKLVCCSKSTNKAFLTQRQCMYEDCPQTLLIFFFFMDFCCQYEQVKATDSTINFGYGFWLWREWIWSRHQRCKVSTEHKIITNNQWWNQLSD